MDDFTHDIDSNNTAIKVHSEALEANVQTQPLWTFFWTFTEVITSKQRSYSIRPKYPAGRIEIRRYMICQELFDKFFGRRWGMLGDLGKSLV